MSSPDTSSFRVARKATGNATIKTPVGTARRLAARSAPRWALALRLACAGLASVGLAGCFQPMYAESTPGAGPGLRERMRDVEIVEIQGRLGKDLRNDLIYELNGGEGNPKGAPLQLIITAKSSITTALVNTSSGLPENEIVRVTADWRLVKAGDKTLKALTGGKAFGSATIDVSDQRFANYSAAHNAEARAARVVSDQIKAQLAAYFIRTPPSGS